MSGVGSFLRSIGSEHTGAARGATEESRTIQTRLDYLPLERYALIGDSGTAALVSDEGSIDWLCLPRFDSAPVFGRLLDPGAGHFSLRPAEPFGVARRYVPDTAVLETTYTVGRAKTVVHDFFAVRSGPARARGVWPFRYLIRRIEGLEGVVPFDLEIVPRDSFGGGRYRLSARGCRLMALRRGRGLLLQASFPLHAQEGVGHGEVSVPAGSVAWVALAYAGRDLGTWPPVGELAERAFRQTQTYWQAWSRRGGADGPERDQVRRGAITLKLLTYAASGAAVAAPTTSLPETVAGVRNWDYRYVWVRDASWTIRALFDLGFPEEAKAYLFWVTNAARLTLPRVHTMYTLYGIAKIHEHELPSLRGYLGSRPVRWGNAAAGQLQLDNWGHVVDAAFTFACRMGRLDGGVWASISTFVQFTADNWRRPDQGIWEVREDARHFVHSKVMCWVALDRGIRLVREFGLRGPAEAWERERDCIAAAVFEHGVGPDGHFLRSFGEDEVDASLLLLPIVGFVSGRDERMQRTIDRVRRDLGCGELLYRYRCDDGLPGREGAFLACSFWLAHALALAGRQQEARDVFTGACRRGNDLGLFPEEIDPETGRFLGNFPQGLSHIAMLNAAVALSDTTAEGDMPPRDEPMG